MNIKKDMNNLAKESVHNKSIAISIPIPLPTKQLLFENENISNEYGLKEFFFDPSKSSPPNEFLLKLHKRVQNYSFTKDSKCINA